MMTSSTGPSTLRVSLCSLARMSCACRIARPPARSFEEGNTGGRASINAELPNLWLKKPGQRLLLGSC
jgi:hypothetical protein